MTFKSCPNDLDPHNDRDTHNTRKIYRLLTNAVNTKIYIRPMDK